MFIVHFCCVGVCRYRLGGRASSPYWIFRREVGLCGKTDSGGVEFGREACRVRKSPTYRWIDRGKCMKRSDDAQVGDADVSGRF